MPIGHITNGIHLLGWMKGSVRQFWRRESLTNAAEASANLLRRNDPILAQRLGRTGQAINSRRILGKDGRPGLYLRRGTLGVALQAAPRTDRVRPPPAAVAKPARSRRAISSASTIC